MIVCINISGQRFILCFCFQTCLSAITEIISLLSFYLSMDQRDVKLLMKINLMLSKILVTTFWIDISAMNTYNNVKNGLSPLLISFMNLSILFRLLFVYLFGDQVRLVNLNFILQKYKRSFIFEKHLQVVNVNIFCIWLFISCITVQKANETSHINNIRIIFSTD